MLPICWISVEAGGPAETNTMSRVNQNSKGGEAWTKKQKRTNEVVAVGRIVPRKKK